MPYQSTTSIRLSRVLEARKCPTCDATGRFTSYGKAKQYTVQCPRCHGTGTVRA